MLKELNIKNFVIIDNLKVKFDEGLNILTGETGAGKSILIDAISGILGDKMTTDMIRTGFEKATLDGIFNITNIDRVKKILNDSGIDFEDNTLVLRRELYASGRGKCFANFTHVPISKLKEIAEYLVDIHGQNEHQSITKIFKHRELLDSFAGNGNYVNEIKSIHEHLHALKDRLESYDIDEKEKNRRIEYNTFAVNEIESAGLKFNEEEELKEESVILSNAEKLFNRINSASLLMNGEGGVIEKLKKIEQSMSSVSEYDSEISEILESVRESYFSLEDVSIFLKGYENNIDFSPERINLVEERLALISGLKKKYGDTIEEVLNYCAKAQKEIEAISSNEEELEKLKSEYKSALKAAKDKAFALSERRKEYAKKLETRVMKELTDLGMAGTVFNVSITMEVSPRGEIENNNKTYILYPHGLDRIEFLLSANEGEDLRQLRKVASGGEMSRIMLALKNVILSSDIVESLIFDEVDAGISGKTAEIVGKKLKTLSKDRQVMVITHLPQIAAMGDSNYSVLKIKSNERITTSLKHLNKGEKIKEVARMLAGEKITELTLKHAEELIMNTGG